MAPEPLMLRLLSEIVADLRVLHPDWSDRQIHDLVLALMVLVPLTLRVVTPVTAPPKLALPVTTSALLPPASVLLKVTLLSVVVSVLLPPSVTAPV